jgi:hypothetical protein
MNMQQIPQFLPTFLEISALLFVLLIGLAVLGTLILTSSP